MKQCERCGKEIGWRWPKKYCLACSKIVYKEQQDKRRKEHNK